MQFRSTNGKFTHFSGDVVSNVDDSSHGVKLSGGSTGGVVEAVGDETNIALTVRGKGSGGVAIGSASGSTQSAVGMKGIYASSFTVQVGAISSGAVVQAALSTAFGNFATGDLISIDAIVTPAEAVFAGFRTAADATTRVSMSIANPGSTATSTGRVVGTITWIDLT